jgi:hypothetical protein
MRINFWRAAIDALRQTDDEPKLQQRELRTLGEQLKTEMEDEGYACIGLIRASPVVLANSKIFVRSS